MNKYRKKPVIIEAAQWFKLGDVPEANITLEYYGYACGNVKCTVKAMNGICKTLEANMVVCPGDWIIKGVEGEFYPCKPSIFDKTYEVVDDEI